MPSTRRDTQLLVRQQLPSLTTMHPLTNMTSPATKQHHRACRVSARLAIGTCCMLLVLWYTIDEQLTAPAALLPSSAALSHNWYTTSSAEQPVKPNARQLDHRYLPAHNLTATFVFPHKATTIDWVAAKLAPHYHTMVYSYNDPNATHYAPDRCNEVDTYLQYIIEHYHDLPDVTLFLHNHEISWHTVEPGIVQTIQTLNWNNILQRDLMSFTCNIHASHKREGGMPAFWEFMDREWATMFSGHFGQSPPSELAAHAAASMAVTCRAIQRQSLAFYRAAKDYCTHTTEDPAWTGRVYEYAWQKVFLDTYIQPKHDCCDLSEATCLYSKPPRLGQK